MALKDTIAEVLAKAVELRAAERGGNEANTKALLIEPMLEALGWDTADLSQVEREYRVFDSTSLDYALKVDGKARLFVEAKAVGKDLSDRSFIAQAVNYANNERQGQVCVEGKEFDLPITWAIFPLGSLIDSSRSMSSSEVLDRMSAEGLGSSTWVTLGARGSPAPFARSRPSAGDF